MDWNKTKTIFIVVFSVLNVFLYSLYINRHTEAQNVQVMWETTIEESLQADNIKYEQLPDYNEEYFYISAEIATFTGDQLKGFKNQEFDIVDPTHLYSKLKVPVSLPNKKENADFKEFLLEYVVDGEEYVLWKVDKERKHALFFQIVNDDPIYFNENAMLNVYWDSDGAITSYDQRMFGEFVNYNKKKDLLAPIQAINTLYSRSYLKPDSTVLGMTLGYSTRSQLTKRQVFAPTWHVRVELKDGGIEEYFINAIEGKIIEFETEPIIDENE